MSISIEHKKSALSVAKKLGNPEQVGDLFRQLVGRGVATTDVSSPRRRPVRAACVYRQQRGCRDRLLGVRDKLDTP